MLKFRCETSIGYKSRKLSRVAFWGVIRALQSNINICYYPHPAAPNITYNWRSVRQLAGYMRMDSTWGDNTVCMVPQSVRYRKLLPPSMLRPAASQARLHGVLGPNLCTSMLVSGSNTVKVLSSTNSAMRFFCPMESPRDIWCWFVNIIWSCLPIKSSSMLLSIYVLLQ